MRLYDATLPIREGMWVFPLDPPYKAECIMDADKGDMYTLHKLSFGNHLGTHVDAPSHYLKGGITLDQIPSDVLLGPGVVFDMRGKSRVDREDLEAAFSEFKEKPTRVLLKTDNGPWLLKPASEFPGDPYKDFVAITENGARYLVEMGAKLVGMDYQSVGPETVHHILWEAGVTIIEGAHLLDVPPGSYEILCLPLLIIGADGAPARMILRQQV